MVRAGPNRMPQTGSKMSITGHVGFDGLPDQLVNKCVKRGFQFNILCIGETACGKSTLLDSLFKTDFTREEATHSLPKPEIRNHYYDIQEKDVRLRLGLAQSIGLGDAIDRTPSMEVALKYIQDQFEHYLQEEINIHRDLSTSHDTRCHVCLYFITPQLNGLKSLDYAMLKTISEHINVVPVICKSDTIDMETLNRLKQNIENELNEAGIEVYDFSRRGESKEFCEITPFAVVGSNQEVDGKRVRTYPWGVVEVENEDHCDFVKLREALLRNNMTDLINMTHSTHYGAYRSKRLREMGFLETTEGGQKDASLEDTYRAKKIQQASEQKRRELELRNEFSQKVAAKQAELEATRNEMKVLHDNKLQPLKNEYQKIVEQHDKIADQLKELRYQVAQAAQQSKSKRSAKKPSTFFGASE